MPSSQVVGSPHFCVPTIVCFRVLPTSLLFCFAVLFYSFFLGISVLVFFCPVIFVSFSGFDVLICPLLAFLLVESSPFLFDCIGPVSQVVYFGMSRLFKMSFV